MGSHKVSFVTTRIFYPRAGQRVGALACGEHLFNTFKKRLGFVRNGSQKHAPFFRAFCGFAVKKYDKHAMVDKQMYFISTLLLYGIFPLFISILLPILLFSVSGLLFAPLLATEIYELFSVPIEFFVIAINIISKIIIFIVFVKFNDFSNKKGHGGLAVQITFLTFSAILYYFFFSLTCSISMLIPCNISDYNRPLPLFNLFNVYILILISLICYRLAKYHPRNIRMVIYGVGLLLSIIPTVWGLDATYQELKERNRGDRDLKEEFKREIDSKYVTLFPESEELKKMAFRLDREEVFEKFMDEVDCKKRTPLLRVNREINVVWDCREREYGIMILKYTKDNINKKTPIINCNLDKNILLNKKYLWSITFRGKENGEYFDSHIYLDTNSSEKVCVLKNHKRIQ